jgi:arylsulfatase A-like enzyme
LELEGVIHPAWTLEPGSALSHVLDIEAGQTLKWSTGGGETALQVGEVALEAPASAVWREQSLDLSPWAGQRLEITHRATGSQWGLLGNLRVESPSTDSLNVVLYLVDTLRADALGVYGAEWETPAYDAFANQGARFAVANSPASWTKPSIPSLMSGIYPTTHRVGAQTLADRLPEQVPLLQERFSQAGWASASFASSPLGSTLSGLDRGFDTAMPPTRWGLERSLGQTPSDRELQEDLFAWWGEQERPIFAYVHTLDVHQYYLKSTQDGGAVEDRSWPAYAQAVQDNDPRFAEFMAQLQASGHDQDTIVVLVSDHGESFWDHGLWSHGTGLAQSQIQIPMVIWAPKHIAPQVIDTPVSLIDVAPTLLDLAGLEPLPGADGHSLRGLMEDGAPPKRDGIGSSLLRFTWTPGAPQQFAWVSTAGAKAWDNGTRMLGFDLVQDPCESRASSQEDAALALETWQAEQERAAGAFEQAYGQGAGAVDQAELELLRALGYVE